MHFASHYRWLVYRELFGEPQPVRSILDIGCDDGGFIGRLHAQTSVAIDPAVDALRRAPADLRVCADGTQMPFREATFDQVVLSDVIEHVEDDQALVAGATGRVKPGGIFWLSTTAINFELFPAQITARAERSWGHVRKGYVPEHLVKLIGTDFDCQVAEWPESIFRRAYFLLWLCSKWMPSLARGLATCCFLVDRHLRQQERPNGHIYIRATRRHKGSANVKDV